MKTLFEFLVKGNIDKRVFSDEDLQNDYEFVENANMKDKKLIALKYDVNSNKYKDIQYKILTLLRDNRKNKNDFTIDDVKWFSRFDIPEQYKKFEALAKEESKQFLEYYMKIKEDKLKHIYCGHHMTLFNFVDKNLGSQWNYYYSYADKYQLNLYKNVRKYLTGK